MRLQLGETLFTMEFHSKERVEQRWRSAGQSIRQAAIDPAMKMKVSSNNPVKCSDEAEIPPRPVSRLT